MDDKSVRKYKSHNKHHNRSRSVRRSYDEKVVGMNKSAERLAQLRLRRIVILVWLVICIAAGVLFYQAYARKHMSDTPKVAIRLREGVKTGVPLTEGAEFGPWAGNVSGVSDK